LLGIAGRAERCCPSKALSIWDRIGGLAALENREKTEYDRVISTYFADEHVSAIVYLKVDTKEADTIAERVSGFDVVEDVFLVTGDNDVLVKVRFRSYDQLKQFLMNDLSPIPGIKDMKTSMVVTTFKEKGELKFEPPGEDKGEN